MEGDKEVPLRVVGDLRFVKGGIILIRGSRVHHIITCVFQPLSHCQCQAQIIVLFFSVFVGCPGVKASVARVYDDSFSHMFSFAVFFYLYSL